MTLNARGSTSSRQISILASLHDIHVHGFHCLSVRVDQFKSQKKYVRISQANTLLTTELKLGTWNSSPGIFYWGIYSGCTQLACATDRQLHITRTEQEGGKQILLADSGVWCAALVTLASAMTPSEHGSVSLIECECALILHLAQG